MVKVKVPNKAGLARFFIRPAGKALLVLGTLAVTLGFITFTYYYFRYSRLIETKLKEGPFAQTAMIFAAPKTLSVGDRVTLEEIVAQLKRSGYSESRSNPMGWYHLRPGAIEIFPGPNSYFDQETAVVKVSAGRVVQIVSTQDNTERP